MKRRLLDRMLALMPKSVRHWLIRYRAQVPEFALDKRFSIEIARSRKDLESAYAILHDAYVDMKLMAPQASGLRCNIYSFLPNTTVVVAKFDGKVIGTVSLIRDSRWGIPSDKEYGVENSKLRKSGRSLVEVSALAVSKQFRRRGNAVSLLLMKYLYNYTYRDLASDCLICTVHPRAEDFYQALWQFERSGDVVDYEFVQGAPAVHLSLTISPESQRRIVGAYPSISEFKNLALFVLQSDDRFRYPQRTTEVRIDPIYTPAMFRYFSTERTNVWSTLSQEARSGLIDIYGDVSGDVSDIFNGEKGLDLSGGRLAGYRIPTELRAMIRAGEKTAIVQLNDLSSSGAFLRWPAHLPPIGQRPEQKLTIAFELGSERVSLECRVAWRSNSDGTTHLADGFGIQFVGAGINASLLNGWMYGGARVSELGERIRVA